MIVEFLGKFYDNHSLSIVNRNLVLALRSLGVKIRILPIDSYDPEFKLEKEIVKQLKELEIQHKSDVADIQIRHSYPPIWAWPENSKTKVVFIQPWEFPKAPFEWQYKFETFADALVVPSNFCKKVFLSGGINPDNVFTVPNGYDSTVYNQDSSTTNEQDSKFTFVYVGNAQWRKGLEILLNSWSKAFKSYDKVRLVIKDNPSVYGRNNVLNEIIKLQYLTDCAEIHYIDENLSDIEMANIYKNSQAIVHPYRAEGFGMHIQEAMACGCYPIVSANGPTDEFVPTQEFTKIQVKTSLVDINDPKIFATKSGDSVTLMGSHTFINEPIADSLLRNMVGLYSSHNHKELYEKLNKSSTLNTWTDSAHEMLEVLDTIHKRTTIRKGN